VGGVVNRMLLIGVLYLVREGNPALVRVGVALPLELTFLFDAEISCPKPSQGYEEARPLVLVIVEGAFLRSPPPLPTLSVSSLSNKERYQGRGHEVACLYPSEEADST
jgi:hypothetical protein